MKPALIKSYVGTWARVGCAAFHVQLRKAYFVTTLDAICTCVCVTHACVGLGACHVSSRPVLVIWVYMIRNSPGNAQVCLGLQVPMPALALTQ